MWDLYYKSLAITLYVEDLMTFCESSIGYQVHNRSTQEA